MLHSIDSENEQKLAHPHGFHVYMTLKLPIKAVATNMNACCGVS